MNTVWKQWEDCWRMGLGTKFIKGMNLELLPERTRGPDQKRGLESPKDCGAICHHPWETSKILSAKSDSKTRAKPCPICSESNYQGDKIQLPSTCPVWVLKFPHPSGQRQQPSEPSTWHKVLGMENAEAITTSLTVELLSPLKGAATSH